MAPISADIHANITVLGCKVIATASSEAKRAICVERAGADAAVDYTQKDWQVSRTSNVLLMIERSNAYNGRQGSKCRV